MVDEGKLLLLVSLPLLERETIFDVFKIINPPIPYLEGVVASYKLARTRFMLTPEEATQCETNVLDKCPSRSPVYVRSGHRLCVLGLFRIDMQGNQGGLPSVIITGKVLPQAVGLSDGVSTITLGEKTELSKVRE